MTTVKAIGTAETGTRRTNATWISLCAIVISLTSLGVSLFQANLGQVGQDRASGKIRTKFEFVGVGNTDEKTLAPFYKMSFMGFQMVHLEDVSRLVRWGPYVEIRNTGSEVIDGIRGEIQFTDGVVSPPEGMRIPYALNEPTDVEIPLKQKLHPGQTATVSIMKPLVAQILKVQGQATGEKWKRNGRFPVRAYCKIVGGPTASDRPEPFKEASLRFSWIPEGFTRDDCKGVLESQPLVSIAGP
jgi:hypothetical protein